MFFPQTQEWPSLASMSRFFPFNRIASLSFAIADLQIPFSFFFLKTHKQIPFFSNPKSFNWNSYRLGFWAFSSKTVMGWVVRGNGLDFLNYIFTVFSLQTPPLSYLFFFVGLFLLSFSNSLVTTSLLRFFNYNFTMFLLIRIVNLFYYVVICFYYFFLFQIIFRHWIFWFFTLSFGFLAVLTSKFWVHVLQYMKLSQQISIAIIMDYSFEITYLPLIFFLLYSHMFFSPILQFFKSLSLTTFFGSSFAIFEIILLLSIASHG